MNINSEYSRIYSAVTSYFGNPVMVKGITTPPDRFNRQFSIYYARIGCLLCIDNQYLVAVIGEDTQPIGNTERLNNLKWISFQTRKFEDSPAKMKTQEIKSVIKADLQETVTVSNKLIDRWVYEPQFSPLKLELLLDEDTSNYSETGTLKSCLDTYMCVLTFIQM